MNGRIHGELKNPDLSPEDDIRHRVRLLDGVKRYSLMLWAMPPGLPLDSIDLHEWPQEYIQAAGSKDQLAVEIRRIVDGSPQQYVVGHDTGTAGQSPESEVVSWNGCETIVQLNELFDAAEVGELFVEYYLTNSIPASHVLRKLDL